tara:strand:+ start:8321 stop:8713 length:393 start_codon:yes stop_codon:yes gene_type:complete
MAVHKGSEGVAKIGSNTVAELKEYSVEESADVIESTELSDSTKSFEVGQTSWSGSMKCSWDETDTNGQESMTVGASVTLNLYPEGATSGDQYATGTVLITSVGVSASINGLIERSFAFQGTGALTWGAVS